MKKKILKWLIGIVATLIVLAVVLVVGIVIFINPIVKTTTETLGPALTKAPVTLGRSNISIFGLSVDLEDLKVGSPEGYDADQSLGFKQIYIDVDQSTLFNDIIIVDSVLVDGLGITLEQGLTSNNIQAILNNVKAFVGAEEAKKTEPEPEATEEKKDEGAGKKVVIRRLSIINAQVGLSIKGTGGAQAPIPVLPIHINNIGGDPDAKEAPKGATIAEVVETMLSSVLNASSGALKAAGELLKDAGKVTGETLEKAGDQAKDVLKDAGEGVKDAAKGIRDLF